MMFKQIAIGALMGLSLISAQADDFHECGKYIFNSTTGLLTNTVSKNSVTVKYLKTIKTTYGYASFLTYYYSNKDGQLFSLKLGPNMYSINSEDFGIPTTNCKLPPEPKKIIL